MKLCGEFVVREIMDNVMVIPVGQIALRFNGMIMLNNVSRILWTCLEQGTDIDTMVTALTDAFDVSADEARADILEFVDQLRTLQLLEE